MGGKYQMTTKRAKNIPTSHKICIPKFFIQGPPKFSQFGILGTLATLAPDQAISSCNFMLQTWVARFIFTQYTKTEININQITTKITK
jgi:hypothetical protein